MAKVIGIDVGGKRKGFHAVLYHSSAFKLFLSIPTQFNSSPGLYRTNLPLCHRCPLWMEHFRGSRESERSLAHQGKRIPCFCTPTRARAAQSRFYDWVFNGEQLYQAFQRQSITPIETYPHGVSEIILQRNPLPAKSKHDAKQRSPRWACSPLLNISRFDRCRSRCVDRRCLQRASDPCLWK